MERLTKITATKSKRWSTILAIRKPAILLSEGRRKWSCKSEHLAKEINIKTFANKHWLLIDPSKPKYMYLNCFGFQNVSKICGWNKLHCWNWERLVVRSPVVVYPVVNSCTKDKIVIKTIARTKFNRRIGERAISTHIWFRIFDQT